MPILLLFRLAWRNLVRNARRSAFGLTTIAFGVAGLALAAGFIEDVYDQLGEATISGQLGHLQVTRPGFHEGGSGSPEEYLIADSYKWKASIESDPRVQAVMGRLSFSGLLSLDGSEIAVEAEGVEPTPEARLGSRLEILAGRNLQANDGAVAVLGEGVANRLKAAIGDVLTLTAPTLDGSLNVVDIEVVGVFRSFSKEFDERALRIPLQIVHELLQTEAVNVLIVHLHNTSDTGDVLRSVVERLAGSNLQVEPWYELSDFYANTRMLYARQFGFLRWIALILVMMSVVNSLNMTVFERTAEFGTMRVLGNRSTDVVTLIAVEALLLGILGAFAGALLAVGAAQIISHIGIPMPPPPNMEGGYTARILVLPFVLLDAAVIGILSSAIAGFFPALRLVRLSPVDALRAGV